MKETVSSRIEKQLRQRIYGLTPEARIPNELDLCREFSVSRMTINKILGKLVQDNLVYRIKKKGSFVKDRRITERPIYFLLPVIDYFSYNSSITHRRTLAGLNAEASLLNRKIEFLPVTRTNVHNDFDWPRLNEIKCRDQVFVMGFWYKKLFPFLQERECEVVLINNGVWIEDEYKKIISTWYSLNIERKSGVENCLVNLAHTGKKKPLLLYTHSEKEHPVTEGFKSGVKKAGLELIDELLVKIDGTADPFNSQPATLGDLHKKYGFDSIILSLALPVKGILDELERSGLRVPEDISLICLDEDPVLTEITPSVSAVATPFQEIGQETARIFNRDIFLPGETRFRQTLIERESTRKGAGSMRLLEYLPELKVFETPLYAGVGRI